MHFIKTKFANPDIITCNGIFTVKKEMLEIWDWETARPTGKPVARDISHRDGIPHESVHLWIIRTGPGGIEILFQHRAKNKEMYPDCLDITVAGHVPFGLEKNKISKEAREEIGISISDIDLADLGLYRYEEITDTFFHREFQKIYLLLDNRPLDRYRFIDGEVSGICAIKLDDLERIMKNDVIIPVESYSHGTLLYGTTGRDKFHPQLFDDSMKLYMDAVISASRELAAHGSTSVKLTPEAR